MNRSLGWEITFAILMVSLTGVTANAQYDTAPASNYPDNYMGRTFTGEVTEASGDRLTLTHTEKGKTDTFVGRFETSCAAFSKSGRPVSAEDIRTGTLLTAFFNHQYRKKTEKKEKENVIIGISFDASPTQKKMRTNKMIFSCAASRNIVFQAYQPRPRGE